MNSIQITPTDLSSPHHCAALCELMNSYASDIMGGGEALSEDVLAKLPSSLALLSSYYAWLAWDGERAVGILNAFTGFSTFAAQPLLNVHDLAVIPEYRGRGIARDLLAAAEAKARAIGCCKLTLEVLSNNHIAYAAYIKAGYAPYQLDPGAGNALLLQKKLNEPRASAAPSDCETT